MHRATTLAALLLLAACSGTVVIQPAPSGGTTTATGGAGGTGPVCPSPVSRTFPGNPFLWPWALGADPAGGFLLAGEASGPLHLGAVDLPAGGFVAHLDNDGQPTWAMPRVASPAAAFDAAGNLVVVTETSGPTDFGAGPIGGAGANLVVLAYDPQGALRWNRAFSCDLGHLETPFVAVDEAGGVVVDGLFRGTLELGDGTVLGPPKGADPGCFVLRLDAQGELVHARAMAGTGVCMPGILALDAAGDTLVTATFAGSLTVGSSTVDCGAPYCTLTMRLDPTGAPQWLGAYPATDLESVVMVAEGTTLVTGYTFGTTIDGVALPEGGFLAKLDAEGHLLWHVEVPVVGGIALAPDGDILVASAGSILRLDSAGAMLCEDEGDPGGVSGSLVAVDAAGNVLHAASTDGHDILSNTMALIALPR